MDTPLEIPWPLTVETSRHELAAYLERASVPETWDLPTRCAPWTTRDVTRHLAATFQRFADMREQSLTGDLTPPFERSELDSANMRAVTEFAGVPEQRLRAEFDRFVALAEGAGTELMAHQRGPIPVALQLLFGLQDIVIHHDDIAVAAGASYRPHPAVIELLVPVWALFTPPVEGDPWAVRTANR